jgi:hypothetical protein
MGKTSNRKEPINASEKKPPMGPLDKILCRGSILIVQAVVHRPSSEKKEDKENRSTMHGRSLGA